MHLAIFIKALGAFFAIINPFVSLPFFLALTEGASASDRKRSAVKITIYSTVMCLIIFVTGTGFLSLFGVKLDSFRVAGGLVLLTIALGMLSGKGSSAHEGTQGEKAQQAKQAHISSIDFYPMTFPMLIGPGTITTIIVLHTQAHSWTDVELVLLALLIILLAVGVVLFFSAEIGKHLSATLRTIMTRLMGMILAAIAIEMAAAGLVKLLPGLS